LVVQPDLKEGDMFRNLKDEEESVGTEYVEERDWEEVEEYYEDEEDRDWEDDDDGDWDYYEEEWEDN